MLLGADTAPVEVNPNPDKLISLPLHQIALVIYGVHLLENLKLDELAAKNVSRVCLRDAAAQAAGCHRLDGCAGGAAVSGRNRLERAEMGTARAILPTLSGRRGSTAWATAQAFATRATRASHATQPHLPAPAM